MFGLACKGLHCAGCGKGIPLGAVVLGIILAMVAHSAGAITAAFEELIIGAAIVVFLAAIMATAAVMRLMALPENRNVLSGRWEGTGYTELTGHYQSGEPIRQWPDSPVIGATYQWSQPTEERTVEWAEIPGRNP